MKHLNISSYKVFKQCVTLLFIGLLCNQMHQIFVLLIQQTTAYSNSKIENAALSLPSITICPTVAWKSFSNFVTYEEMQKIMFKPHEMFSSSFNQSAVTNSTLGEIKLYSSASNVKATYSKFYGLCYTFEPNTNLTLKHFSSLLLKRSNDYYIIIHSKGDEYWLTVNLLPYEFGTIKTKTKLSQPENGASRIGLNKQTHHSLHGCQRYSTLDYANCGKKKLVRDLMELTNCSLPFYPMLNITIPYPNCTTKADFKASFDILHENFINVVLNNYCLRPCERVQYKIQELNLAQHVMEPELMQDGFLVSFYFLSMEEIIFHENYAYGWDTALAAVGGSMGLFLGWSCQSIIFLITDRIMASMANIKQ